ncbi:MAG: mevalonate kinase [Candidatus Aenigmarchaeota archaeon]|nr:mevalonate kinase [Candidatus Aenigmarchaeota archaeon]
MVAVSAPGKVHLIGEHAVVYGKPAILAAVGKRCRVTAEPSDRVILSDWLGTDIATTPAAAQGLAGKLAGIWQDGNANNDFSKLFALTKGRPDQFLLAAIGSSLNDLEIAGGIRLHADSEITPGAGLGSSAALAVAVPKAIAAAYGQALPKEKNNAMALAIERYQHGRPSGGDNSACCYGGLVWFEQGAVRTLEKEVPYRLENFVMVHFKRNNTTGELVQRIRGLDQVFRNARLDEIGRATYMLREALRKKDFGAMAEAMNIAQASLAQLGVSTPEIDRLAATVTALGGGAKLSGAGGGGMVLCWHADKDSLLRAITDLGYQPVETELGAEGVRVEA